MCGTVGRLGLHPSTQSVVILIPRGIGLVVAGMPDSEGLCVCYDEVFIFWEICENFWLNKFTCLFDVKTHTKSKSSKHSKFGLNDSFA